MAGKSRKKPASAPSVLEWSTGALGLLAILALVAVLVWDAVTGAGSPPEITLSTGQTRATPSGWLVEVEAFNSGGRTAAGLQVEGRLGDETAAIEFDYVPANGRATGALRFSEDPGQGVELLVLGWREP